MRWLGLHSPIPSNEGANEGALADQEKMRLETMNADEKNRSTQRVVDDVAAIVASSDRVAGMAVAPPVSSLSE